MVFLGEHKRPGQPRGPGIRRPVPSIIFLEPGSAELAGARPYDHQALRLRPGRHLRRVGALAGRRARARDARDRPLGGDQPADAAGASGRARPVPGRDPHPLARIPTPGWICALVALLSALTWSLIVPLFQVPDEQAHVAYAQHLAEVAAPPAGHRDASATLRRGTQPALRASLAADHPSPREPAARARNAPTGSSSARWICPRTGREVAGTATRRRTRRSTTPSPRSPTGSPPSPTSSTGCTRCGSSPRCSPP